MALPVTLFVRLCGRLCVAVLLVLFSARGSWAVEAAAVAAGPTVEELRLETSDGIRIAAWYYPAPEDAKAVATVILVHDLEGSHKTVDNLARNLQRAGCAVVAPDLRGHGGSGFRPASQAGSGPKSDAVEPRLLKKVDLESMAAATGGRLRDQSALRGEIEAVRNWIKQKSDAGTLDIERLCVVGCGLGGTLASMWTAADWNWPPTTAGPQGQQVRALALISPVWATKGVSMSLPLTSEAIQHAIPIMVVAGKGDRDAIRLFDQLKRFRPDAWFQQRAAQPMEKAKDLEDPAEGTAFFIQVDTSLTADKLANEPALNVADQIKTFFALALARKPK
jgi:alpha-beta hydrolase superfamily lysophospholipase